MARHARPAEQRARLLWALLALATVYSAAGQAPLAAPGPAHSLAASAPGHSAAGVVSTTTNSALTDGVQNAVLGSLLPAGTGAGVTTGQTTGSAAGYTGAGSGARRGASTASNPIEQSSGSLLPAGQAGTAAGSGGSGGGGGGSATQPGGAYTSGVQQGGYSSGNIGNNEANPIGAANSPPTGYAPAGYDTGSPGIASPGSGGAGGSGGGAYMTGTGAPSPPGPQASAPPQGPSWSQGTMDGTLAAGGVLGGGIPVPGVSDGGAAPGSGKIGLQAGLSKAVAAVAMNGVSAGGLFNISALFACQVVQGNCAVCHPLDKTRCMACSAPFAVTTDGTCDCPAGWTTYFDSYSGAQTCVPPACSAATPTATPTYAPTYGPTYTPTYTPIVTPTPTPTVSSGFQTTAGYTRPVSLLARRFAGAAPAAAPGAAVAPGPAR